MSVGDYLHFHDIVALLREGAIGVVPTDTTYGIIGDALSPKVVERMYQVRQRPVEKPFIVLLGSLDDFYRFDIHIDTQTNEFLSQIWPGPVSVVMPCKSSEYSYLTRNTASLAFRIPDKSELREVIKSVGPLIAPSANIAGTPVAQTIQKAQESLGDKVDFYVNGGVVGNPPSTLIAFSKKGIHILREGAVPSNAIIQQYIQTSTQ